MAYEREPITKTLFFENPAAGQTGATRTITHGGADNSTTTEPFSMAGRGTLSYAIDYEGASTVLVEALTLVNDTWVEPEGDFDIETLLAGGGGAKRLARVAGLPYLDRLKLRFTTAGAGTATINSLKIMLA